jgi:uncharacterized membrane protein
MNYVILGLVIAIAGIGLIRFSGILGILMLIIGLSIMMKGKRDFDKN